MKKGWLIFTVVLAYILAVGIWHYQSESPLFITDCRAGPIHTEVFGGAQGWSEIEGTYGEDPDEHPGCSGLSPTLEQEMFGDRVEDESEDVCRIRAYEKEPTDCGSECRSYVNFDCSNTDCTIMGSEMDPSTHPPVPYMGGYIYWCVWYKSCITIDDDVTYGCRKIVPGVKFDDDGNVIRGLDGGTRGVDEGGLSDSTTGRAPIER